MSLASIATSGFCLSRLPPGFKSPISVECLKSAQPSRCAQVNFPADLRDSLCTNDAFCWTTVQTGHLKVLVCTGAKKSIFSGSSATPDMGTGQKAISKLDGRFSGILLVARP